MTQALDVAADPATDAPDMTGAVALAYVHSERVSYSWHHSMTEFMGFDFANAGRVVRGGFVSIHCGTDGLVDARNKAVATFLAERQAEWLWWLDTDMGFPPDALDRLLAVADPDARPIVGALAFSQRQFEVDEMGGWRCRATPTIFDWEMVDDKQGFSVRCEYPDNMAVRAAGTGSACILIHRSVFERIAAEHGPVWYNRIPNPSMGQLTSEDLSFCMRVGALNIPLHIHTGVKTSHHKPVWLAEDDYLRQRALEAAIQDHAGTGEKS
jgi:hypothetical protein